MMMMMMMMISRIVRAMVRRNVRSGARAISIELGPTTHARSDKRRAFVKLRGLGRTARGLIKVKHTLKHTK